LISSKIKGFDF